jgi:hypothetical protein
LGSSRQPVARECISRAGVRVRRETTTQGFFGKFGAGPLSGLGSFTTLIIEAVLSPCMPRMAHAMPNLFGVRRLSAM